MRIRFLGPLGRVTGSCYHLTDDARGIQILVDCGAVQGEGAQILQPGRLPFEPAAINHVLLTHAHLDHVGMLPFLVRSGFRGTVWCTRETAAMARINLEDAVRHGQMPYDESDIQRIQWKEPNAKPLFNNLFPIETDIFGCLFRSAHLVGAVSLSITWGARGAQRTILFSGDLGVNEDGGESQALLRYRMDDRDRDYVVCESTYGDKRRRQVPWTERLDRLAEHGDALIASGGVGIVPVFSLGRCQDLLLDAVAVLARDPGRFADLEVILDAPMGGRISNVYAQAIQRMDITRSGRVKPAWLNSALADWLGLDRSHAGIVATRDLVASILRGEAPPDLSGFPGSLAARMDGRRVRHVDGRATIRAGRPTLVLASSGMCTGGPVVEYLKQHLPSPTTRVLFPGYLASGTPGRQLLDLAGTPRDERRLLTGRIALGACTFPAAQVQADIHVLPGYSGHADQDGLVRWLFPPITDRPVARRIFLTHGTDQARAGLEQRLQDEAIVRGSAVEVLLPTGKREHYDLDADTWIESDPAADRTEFLERRIRSLEEALARQSTMTGTPAATDRRAAALGAPAPGAGAQP